MKDLIIIFQALEDLGYDVTGLSFQDGVSLFDSIKEAIEKSGLKREIKR